MCLRNVIGQYRDAMEAISVNMPEPQGKEVEVHMFVESYCEGDKVLFRSRSVFLIYVNTILVQWFSKKQSTIEISVFGTEFVAMKHDIDALRGLRYKLRMMGILISGFLYINGDNVSVVHNAS